MAERAPHDHSTSSHKQFWAQVLDLFETPEDEEYSKTKKGHSILKTVKNQGETGDFTYQAQAEKPEMHQFAQSNALTEVNGSSHACEGTNVCQLWVQQPDNCALGELDEKTLSVDID